jgi:hypothetical protein
MKAYTPSHPLCHPSHLPERSADLQFFVIPSEARDLLFTP